MDGDGPSGGAGAATRRLDALSRHVAGAGSGVSRADTAAGGEATKTYAREPVDEAADVVYSDGLRYTLNTDALTRRERENYEELGYHVVRNLIPQVELDRYADRFRKLCVGEVPMPPLMTRMRDVAAKDREIRSDADVTKIQSFEDEEVLFDYCKHPDVLKYVAAFCGPDIKSMHTMLINKPPDPGTNSSRHPLHQDLHYFPFRPADRVCASWTAMERVTRANGCLVVVPGSHREGVLLEHGYPQWDGAVNMAYHGIMEYDKDWDSKRVWLEMEAGDTVFFHPLLVHGSGANKTKGFRKAISTHYASSHVRFVDTTGSTQDTIRAEIEAFAAKKLGPDAEFRYNDYWKFKSRLVAGVEGREF